MTKEELREIDKRVATELGWKAIRDSVVDEYRGTITGWVEVPVVVGISPKAGGNAGMPCHLPNYTTDPAAADMVIREIARRGWCIDMDMCPLDKGEFAYWDVTVSVSGKHYFVGNPGGELIPDPTGSGVWCRDLCRSFLAACDATQEAREGALNRLTNDEERAQ